MATTTYDIRINSTQAERSLQNLQSKLQGTNEVFGRLRDAIAGVAIGGFITNAVRAAAALDDIASATGIALKNVIGFSNAVQTFGGSFEGANTGISRFINFLESAVDGNKKAQDAFLSLGISLKDLANLSEQDLLRRTVEGLAGLDDQTRRVAIGMAIFGKSFAAVDYQGLNNGIDSFIEKATKQAQATKAAADAEEKFGLAIQNLTSTVLIAIKPLTEFIASIKPETIARLSETIVTLVQVFAGLFVVGRLIPIFVALAQGAATAGGIFRTLFTLLGTTKAVDSAKQGFYLLGATITNVTTVAKTNMSVLGKLQLVVGAFGAGLLKLIPIVGQVIVVAELLGTALEVLTGKGILAWLDEFGKKMADVLGISYKTEEAKRKEAEAVSEAAEKQKEQARAVREVQDALQKEKDALDKVLSAYKEQNVQANKKFQLETQSIGASERAKLLNQERLQAESTYLSEMAKLQDQLNEKRKGGPSDQAMVPAIRAAMDQLTAAYQAQQVEVGKLVDARIRETRANEFKLFQTQSMIDTENKLNDIMAQTATMFLPLQAKGYAELEIAARNAAKAKIEAEAARRGEPLSAEEQARYYAAARQGIESVKAAQDQLNIATAEYNLLQFSLRNQYDMQKKIRDVQYNMATATMSGISKKYAEIEKAADDAARAQIQAEELRTGRTLNEEERLKYFEAARKGIEGLKRAETDAWEASRDGLTGLKKAMAEYVDDATNAAKTVENVFRKATQGMEDMIVNFAKTGKLEWKGFVASMLEELLRSQLRQTMAQLFQISGNQIRGGGGGLFGGSIIPGILAEGGPVSNRRPYIVGERGPELFIPNSAGSMVPNRELGGSTIVNYNISAVDALSFKQLVARDPAFIHAVANQGGKSTPVRR